MNQQSLFIYVTILIRTKIESMWSNLLILRSDSPCETKPLNETFQFIMQALRLTHLLTIEENNFNTLRRHLT